MQISSQNEIDQEVLLITQEECAEVTQAISKVFRFGLYDVFRSKSNRERLEEEVGDLLCMIDLMQERGILNGDSVKFHKLNKRNKLKQWSNIK
jgi:NTP pyrophosphatase (non-canonical NTP hydrolase)